MVLSALSLTGAYLQHQRILARGADRVAVRRGARLAATIVSVAILAWSVAGGWSEISRYALGGDLPLAPVAVWAFLAAWVGLTLAVLMVLIRKLG